MSPAKPHVHMPVQVAHIYFVAFAVLFLVPLVWYGMNMAISALSAVVTTEFSSIFDNDAVSQADSLFTNVWIYMPVLIALGALSWAIMRTLKEKKAGMMYG